MKATLPEKLEFLPPPFLNIFRVLSILLFVACLVATCLGKQLRRRLRVWFNRGKRAQQSQVRLMNDKPQTGKTVTV